jgi:hypothetical protein
MRLPIVPMLLAWATFAQTVVPLADVPAAQRRLAPNQNERVLRCDVRTSKAELNFGLRFQAGYVMGAPLVQYSGTGHTWEIVLKITPEGGEPTYLADRVELPPILDPQFTGEMPGGFLLGEGHYAAEFAAVDDMGRVCRKVWKLDAATGRGERAVKLAIPPNTVADLSWIGSAVGPPGTPAPRRLTVLMNGSEPYQTQAWNWWHFPRVIVPHTAGPQIETPTDYRSALVGILASLLEKLPGTAIRLVVFDLDQQKETFRQDGFTLKDVAKAAHAANPMNHWAVSVSELEHQQGPWSLLASLLRREAQAPVPSDAVLFLGPRLGPLDRMPAHLLEGEKGASQRFFYLQYRLAADPVYYGAPAHMGNQPPDNRLQPELVPEVSDPIDLLVARLKGRTLRVHSPVEFAKAVETIRRGARH